MCLVWVTGLVMVMGLIMVMGLGRESSRTPSRPTLHDRRRQAVDRADQKNTRILVVLGFFSQGL